MCANWLRRQLTRVLGACRHFASNCFPGGGQNVYTKKPDVCVCECVCTRLFINNHTNLYVNGGWNRESSSSRVAWCRTIRSHRFLSVKESKRNETLFCGRSSLCGNLSVVTLIFLNYVKERKKKLFGKQFHGKFGIFKKKKNLILYLFLNSAQLGLQLTIYLIQSGFQ